MLSNSKNKILVIIPAYNEEGSVSGTVQELTSQYHQFKILVVNDGSVDNTATEVARKEIHLISHPFNLGIGGAVQTGLIYAKRYGFDVAVQFDADGQHDAGYIPQILKPVLLGKVDLCIGSRFISQEGHFKSSFLRRLGIKFFANLISFLTGQSLTDPTSGFRAYGKKAIALFADYYPVDFPEPESIMVARRHNLSIGEVPVLMHARQAGNSSIRYLKTAYYMIKVTLAILIDTLKERK